ncbi:MAG: hypothetical protein HYU88_03765 [Chloroflexi bacterium]|nr:hypothetical protein [Chloroflexota bacterium]
MAALKVGSGRYRYEVVRSWGQLPHGWAFGKISGVAVDSQGRVFVYQRTDRPILVFDRDGRFLATWGEGLITDAHGIYVGSDDHVYAVDRDDHQVLKFTPDGTLVMTLGTRGEPGREPGAPFNHPTAAAVGPAGEIYVCDGYANSRVHTFDARGEHLRSWGTPGSAPGQFKVPHGIWVDDESRVYVVDRENNRVQVFTSAGSFVAQWTDFYRPTDVFMDRRHAFYVTDHIPRYSILDSEGNLLARCRVIGSLPHSIYGDSNGDLYICIIADRVIEKHVKI